MGFEIEIYFLIQKSTCQDNRNGPNQIGIYFICLHCIQPPKNSMYNPQPNYTNIVLSFHHVVPLVRVVVGWSNLAVAVDVDSGN